MRSAVLAGAALGVASRLDETAALRLPVSDHATWILAAALAGALARRHAIRAGVAVVTAANLAYYAWIAVAEPGVPLAAVAGSPRHWLALGVVTGAVFGAAGGVLRGGGAVGRAAALTATGAVVVLDRVGALAPLLP